MSAPSNSDFISGIDPTGFATISAAQLLALVSQAAPFTDKGIVLVTVDAGGNPTVPNATVTTKWQNYLWLRQSAASVGVYVWNPTAASDATYLQWQSINIAGIAAGSIQGYQIADNTIPSVKIISLDYSKLIGAPTGLQPTGAAGGSLTGNYPNPAIAASGVTSAMIAAGTIVAGNIANVTLTLALMAPVSGSAKDMARVNAGATGMEAFTPPTLFTSAAVVTTANQFKIPQVATAGAGDTGTWQMVAPTAIGRVLQRTVLSTTTQYDSATAVVAGVLTGANGVDIANLKVVNFVPLSTTSRIRVSVKGMIQKVTNNGFVGIAIFKVATGTVIDGTVNPLAFNANFLPAGATTNYMNSEYEFVSGALTGIDIAARVVGSTNGNATFNPATGYTPASAGSIEVIEYI